MNFDAVDFGYTLPDSIPAGRATLVMRNAGQEIHHAQLVRLNAGVTLDQFMAGLQQPSGPRLDLVSLEGGPGAIPPGATSEVTLDLKEGAYVVLCFVEGQDGVPHFAKGMAKPITVTPATGAATSTAPVASRATFTMKDFTYELPATVAAGRNTYQVTNQGPQGHELQVARLAPGKAVQDVLGFFTNPPSGPPPFQALGGMQGLSSGGTGWLTIDLPAGDYAAYCLIPDVNSGRPHIQLGMISPFRVQ